MFFPEKMRKVNIFVTKDDVEAATVALARSGQLHLSRGGDEEWSDRTPGWRKLVDACENRRHRAGKLAEILKVSDAAPEAEQNLPPLQDKKDIDSILREIEEPVEDWRNERREVENEFKRLRNLIQEIRLLTGLDTPIEEIRKPEYLHRVIGTIPREDLENLKVVLFRVPFVIIPISAEGQRVLIVAATSRNHAEILDRALQVLFFEPVSLEEDLRGRPADALQRYERRQNDCKQRLADLERRRTAMRERFARRLAGLQHRIEADLRVARAVTGYDRHGDVFLISGWIPEDAVETVMTTVATATDGRADVELLEAVPGGRRPVPTFLRNPRLLKPFEKIVSTFGFPGYGEVDPTPLVAVSFLLMYGMMFGDVGHGLMLTAAGLLIRRRYREKAAAIGSILIAAGLSAAVFGALYGSIFGLEHILPHLWLHPLDSILEILSASVVAGIILINIGFTAHLIKTIRVRSWSALLFSRSGLAGIGLYWTLVGGGYAAVLGVMAPKVLMVLVFIAAAVVFLREPLGRLVSGERPLVEEDWASFGVQSFFETFETVIGYVSNTLSFVRLGAFAVAHAGFIGVVFSLAEISGEVLRWPVILVGTLIVVGLEGLIVGIQALRLEYYEFFGKFYEGGGRSFSPMRLSETRKH